MRLSKALILIVFISISVQAQSISLRDQSNQYDFVIITVNKFVPICEEFAYHKNSSRGIKTLVTTRDNILAEFSDSTLVQDNIRQFISYAGTNWSNPTPKYFMFASDIDSIPNFSFISILGYEPTDTAKSDYFYGINILEEDTTNLSFSIGRVAVRTQDELTNYFSKVINYENNSSVERWNNNSLYLADDGITSTNPIASSLFESIATQVSEMVPAYINKKYYYQSDSSEYFGTTDSIVNYVNEYGVSSIYFSGHGNDTIYTHESLFHIDDVDRLTNINSPFFVSFGHSQSYSDINNTSILDEMLFSTDGALLGIAPVGVNYANMNSQINQSIWGKLYTQVAVGDILRETLDRSSSKEYRKYNLFGDPTIILNYDVFADVDPYQTNLPKEFILSQNYPNPFNPTTKITYSIPSNVLNGLKVNLSVYNILGQEVAVLVNSVQNAGNYEVEFNASNLSSGAYLYRLSAGAFIQTSKMILMK